MAEAELIGADEAMAEALREVARLLSGDRVRGGCTLDVPHTLWERVVGGAVGEWKWAVVHDGRQGWGHEWLVQVGEVLCMLRGVRAYGGDSDRLGVGGMGLVPGSDELVDHVGVAVAPARVRAGCGEIYRVLRNDGLGVGEAVVVTELMVGQLGTREARWTAGRTRVMPSV